VCSGSESEGISGTTLTGTGLAGVVFSGTIDCGHAAINGTFTSGINGTFALSTYYCPDAHDTNNAYGWSATGTAPDGSAFTIFLAGSTTARASTGGSVTGGFVGHCDWRLPSIAELVGIRDPSACGGGVCIDQDAFGPVSGDYDYWSATATVVPVYAWTVNFTDPVRAFADEKIYTNAARAVRAAL